MPKGWWQMHITFMVMCATVVLLVAFDIGVWQAAGVSAVLWVFWELLIGDMRPRRWRRRR